MGSHDKKVDVLNLCLGSLLEEGIVDHVQIGVKPSAKPQREAEVEAKHAHDLLFQGVPNSAKFGAGSVLMRRLVGVRVSHLVDIHHV